MTFTPVLFETFKGVLSTAYFFEFLLREILSRILKYFFYVFLSAWVEILYWESSLKFPLASLHVWSQKGCPLLCDRICDAEPENDSYKILTSLSTPISICSFNLLTGVFGSYAYLLSELRNDFSSIVTNQSFVPKGRCFEKPGIEINIGRWLEVTSESSWTIDMIPVDTIWCDTNQGSDMWPWLSIGTFT